MRKAKIVREKEFYKLLLTIALPVTLQNLIIFFTQMLDTIMLGKLGDVAMTASSLANQPFFLFNLFTLGLSGGAAVLAAQYWGKNEIAPIRIITTMVIKFAILIGFIVTILSLMFPREIMSFFINDPLVIEAGTEYLKIMAYAYIFFGFTNTFFSVVRSVEIVKISVISNIVALFLNGTLNFILIFGYLGFPALGVKGAAIATLISRICEFLIALTYMLIVDTRLKIRIKDFFKFEFLLFKDVVRVCTPVVINELMWASGMTMQAVLLGKLGTEAVAANSIVSVVQQLATVAVFGVASAAAVSVGKAIGEGDLQKARDRGHTFKIIAIGFGLFVTAVILILRNFAIDIYNVTDVTKQLANQMMFISAFVGFFVSIAGISLVGILRGGGDTKFSLWIEIIALWMIAIPLAFFAAFVLKWPIPIVYLVAKIDEPVKNVLCLLRMRGVRWIKDLTRGSISNKTT